MVVTSVGQLAQYFRFHCGEEAEGMNYALSIRRNSVSHGVKFII